MEMTIICLILLLYLVSMFVSEIKQITMFTAIGEVALAIWNLLEKAYKKIFHKEEGVISFPTAIGFDANGAFIPSIAEDEFSELKQMFDGLYLSNFNCQQDRYIYFFKYSNSNVDMFPIDMYAYTDKKVAAIVNKFVTRVSGLAEIENVSAIQVEKGILNIFVARNSKGQQINQEWKYNEYNILNEIENEAKRESKPISIKWEDLII